MDTTEMCEVFSSEILWGTSYSISHLAQTPQTKIHLLQAFPSITDNTSHSLVRIR